jgi:periplasmic protein TonB
LHLDPPKLGGGFDSHGRIIMLTIRAPFAALGGALLSVALFLGLAQLVNVPFAVAPPIPNDRQVLKRPRVETPVQTTRRQKIEREPQQLAPGVRGLTRNEHPVVIERVRYMQPRLETRPGSRGGLGLRGFDGDVIPVVQPRPDYPRRAVMGNIEGWVQVRFTVTAIGTVRDAVVVDSEPETVFDDAALEAISRWRYNPRVENGAAVERPGLQTVVRFELEN